MSILLIFFNLNNRYFSLKFYFITILIKNRLFQSSLKKYYVFILSKFILI